jgi:hypothetical protein
MIAEKWKLNTVITTCIGSHHDIKNMQGQAAELQQQVGLVALGNLYANILDHGYAGDPFPAEEDVHTLLGITGLTMEEYCSIGNRVVEEIDKAKIFLQI